jgi:hypothetical protein
VKAYKVAFFKIPTKDQWHLRLGRSLCQTTKSRKSLGETWQVNRFTG